MTPSDTSRPAPPAVAAFLRGLRSRASLLARVQAGTDAPARQHLAAVERVFAADAGLWPLAEWPGQYWRLVLSMPSLRRPEATAIGSPLPGVARLPAQQRAAVLLLVVAGLDKAAAAEALGIPEDTCEQAIRASLPLDALGQPDVDVWRAWRSAAERVLADAETLAEAAHAPVPAATDAVTPAAPHASRRLLRGLWFGLAACAVALVASLFLHPKGRAALERLRDPIKHEALRPASAPKARFDVRDVALHPDRERLSAPSEAGYADDMAMLAWLADASSDVRAADAVRLPLAPVPVPGPVPGPAIAPDAAARAGALARRVRQWDALPSPIRGARRAHWQAWRALDARERAQLRAIAPRWQSMSADARLPLQQRFDAQSPDARAGWWLGPRMGRDWPRLTALFAYVDAGERTALLRLLRESSAGEIDALERLAQGTPPEARAGLRRELLVVPRAQRAAWLQARTLR